MLIYFYLWYRYIITTPNSAPQKKRGRKCGTMEVKQYLTPLFNRFCLIIVATDSIYVLFLEKKIDHSKNVADLVFPENCNYRKMFNRLY